MSFGPVVIEHIPHHRFVKRPSRGCAVCGRAKTHPDHHAYPESFNEGGSGHNHFAYQNAKKAWQARLIKLLAASELPRPLARVVVEGELTFTRRFGKGPDQENFRYPLSKFLGDAMVEGGWIVDDDWGRFEFGGLAYRLEPAGTPRMVLTVFPTL